ncbi:hypothetical protein H312_01213 [Anncaliia algerae PRA339]|uniref:Uncharacterized protein n=1 Tax=Anncaliia algerae PRA339 TaxID=1288291 RepID=A0A059F2U7_9MICR|nr:hypothetical protein H312_01213 [Anncaliia algerae PRA339]
MQEENKRTIILENELNILKETTNSKEKMYINLTKEYYIKKLAYDVRMYEYIKLKETSTIKESEMLKLEYLPIKERKPLIPCVHNKNSEDSLRVLKDFEIKKLTKENTILKDFIQRIASELNYDDQVFKFLEDVIMQTRDKNMIEFVNENLFKFRKKE